MKIRRLVILVLGAVALVPALLQAKEEAKTERRYFTGIMGGFSLLSDKSVDQSVFPGVYPNRLVLGLFVQTDFSIYEDDMWPQMSGQLELYYLDQASTFDVVVRDEFGNIIEIYPERYSRKYLELVSLINARIRGGRGRLVPVLSIGPGVTLLLKTTRRPAGGEPHQAEFRGFVFDIVFGAGLEYRVGRHLLCLNARYDIAGTLKEGREAPKPSSFMILVGIGF